MLSLSNSPDRHISRWLGTTLEGESCRDLVSICQLEIDRLRFRDEVPSNHRLASGSMGASWKAILEFVRNKSDQMVSFEDLESVLSVEKTKDFVTVQRGNHNEIANTFRDSTRPTPPIEHDAAFMRSIEILAVRETLGYYYVQLAAIQLGEIENCKELLRAYKGVTQRPRPDNAWFFANGVVRSICEAEHLAATVPHSQLVPFKREMASEFFDGLNESLQRSAARSFADIGREIRARLQEAAHCLGYRWPLAAPLPE
jgi:hypothetical protein